MTWPAKHDREVQLAQAGCRKCSGSQRGRLGESLQHDVPSGLAAEGNPTANNNLNAIDLLKAATETDAISLFIAGHGFNDARKPAFSRDQRRMGWLALGGVIPVMGRRRRCRQPWAGASC